MTDPLFEENPRLDELEFLASHNSQQGSFQVCVRPAVAHLITCLKHGCRALEVDMYMDGDQNPVLRHGRCWGGLPLQEALEVIDEWAFRETEYPLLVFVDHRIPNEETALHRASNTFRTVLGTRLYCPRRPIRSLRLQECRGKVLVVSFPRSTASIEWNRIVTDSPYGSGFRNVDHRTWFSESEDERDLEGRMVRVYTKNLLVSRNFDPTSLLGRIHFIALNLAHRDRHVDLLLSHFEGHNGIRRLSSKAETAHET